MPWQFYGFMEPTHTRIYGPLPRKRWIKKLGEKYKLAYRAPKTVRRPTGDADKYNERRAIEYALWLARRDSITLPTKGYGHANWGGFTSKFRTRQQRRWDGTIVNQPVFCRRIRSVSWGAVTIEIPNWDFEHPPIADLDIAEAA